MPKPLDLPWDEEGYRFTATLGTCAYPTVYLAYPNGNLDEEPYAIKRVRTTDVKIRSHADSEITALLALGKHPRLTELVRYYSSPDCRHICLVMTYYPCDLLGYMHFHLQAIPWPHRKVIFLDLLRALSFMHSNHYVHLDVKLENVLLTFPPHTDEPPRAVLGDHGYARYVPSENYMML